MDHQARLAALGRRRDDFVARAVIGLGFGDEGKGKVVGHLCLRHGVDLVVRFCGGHQAGHKVMHGPFEHIFSNFGSGTAHGVPTYWSRFCTVDPVGLMNEYEALAAKGVEPVLHLDERCPVTTPFDKAHNVDTDLANNHGSVGVGVGQTHQREEDHHSLTVYDLQFPWVLNEKLKLLKKFYYGDIFGSDDVIPGFVETCRKLLGSGFVNVVPDHLELFHGSKSVVFEGSQGLMLDQRFGFFPHVTRSNTGLENIVVEFGFLPKVYLVTRAYCTRHGNGPMPNEGKRIVVDNPYEGNSDTGFQGKFRTAPLELSLLRYAMGKDEYLRDQDIRHNLTLVVTCLDAVKKNYWLTDGDSIWIHSTKETFLKRIKSGLEVRDLLVSESPFSKDMWRF